VAGKEENFEKKKSFQGTLKNHKGEKITVISGTSGSQMFGDRRQRNSGGKLRRGQPESYLGQGWQKE